MEHSGKITSKSDHNGVAIEICSPTWFNESGIYKIKNSPPRTASLEFKGDDLNFVARVLYAESSGSLQTTEAESRMKEKLAILNVKHFRLNRRGYPNNKKAQSFKEVCEAPGQFESVYLASPKFSSSQRNESQHLKKHECKDLEEALEAIKKFLEEGPNQNYVFDNFRGGIGTRGTTIGKTRFWLSQEGEKFYAKED